MTYRIEKFDDDMEALLMMAIVRDNVVDLDWLHDEDDPESHAQRCLARVKTIFDTNASSYSPQTAFLMMRLYRRGDVAISSMGCADGYRDQAMRLAKEAALDLYDSVFPDVAEMARAFVEENVENATRLAADSKLSDLAIEQGEQLSPDQFLPRLLDLAKANLTETGEVVQRIGWLVNQGMALIPIGRPPLEKYRYFRAVGEVARRVNADAIVYVSDGYELSPSGERTGAETLLIMWINPNGTCVSKGVSYTRRSDIVTFSTDLASAPESKQNLVPAWGNFRPN
jgi:hypothetical protein